MERSDIYSTNICDFMAMTQIQGFKKMFVGALQETSSKLNYLQAHVLPPSYAQKETCEKEHEAERKDYQEETFSFTTKLLTICFTLFATWGLKGIHGLSLGSLMCAKGSESYLPICRKSTQSSKT